MHHGLISAHLCRLCRSRCEGCDGAEIFAVCPHHQVGTSWLSPRHSIEIKDFHLRARHGGGRSRKWSSVPFEAPSSAVSQSHNLSK